MTSSIIPTAIGGLTNSLVQMAAGTMVVGTIGKFLGGSPMANYIAGALTGALALWVGNEVAVVSAYSMHSGKLPGSTRAGVQGVYGGYAGPGMGTLSGV